MLAGCPHPSSLMPVGLPHASKQSAFTSLLLSSPLFSSQLHHLPGSGDGNFHVLLMLRADVPEDVKEAHRLAGDIATTAISMGGTCTGEHGESCLQIGWCDVKYYIDERLNFPFSISLSLHLYLSYFFLVLHSNARVSTTDTCTHTMTHCITTSALIASWIPLVIIIFIIEIIKITVIITNTLLTILTLCVMSRHWCGQEGVPSSRDGWGQHVDDGKN